MLQSCLVTKQEMLINSVIPERSLLYLLILPQKPSDVIYWCKCELLFICQFNFSGSRTAHIYNVKG